MLLKDIQREIVSWIGQLLIEIIKEMIKKKSLKNSSRKNSLWPLLQLLIKSFCVIKSLISNRLKKNNLHCMIKNLVKRNSPSPKSPKIILKSLQTIPLKSLQ